MDNLKALGKKSRRLGRQIGRKEFLKLIDKRSSLNHELCWFDVIQKLKKEASTIEFICKKSHDFLFKHYENLLNELNLEKSDENRSCFLANFRAGFDLEFPSDFFKAIECPINK